MSILYVRDKDGQFMQIPIFAGQDSGGNVDLAIAGATIGQTVMISAVDENGVPTTWEAVDFPSGGGDLKTETWTFQLADGSTITKEVCVK